MVGIVVVSHSQKIAEGAVELAKQMAPEAKIAAAGGMEDGSIGTDVAKISDAIEAVDQGDGVVILVDLGSAVMSSEMAIEMREGGRIKCDQGNMKAQTCIFPCQKFQNFTLVADVQLCFARHAQPHRKGFQIVRRRKNGRKLGQVGKVRAAARHRDATLRLPASIGDAAAHDNR